MGKNSKIQPFNWIIISLNQCLLPYIFEILFRAKFPIAPLQCAFFLARTCKFWTDRFHHLYFAVILHLIVFGGKINRLFFLHRNFLIDRPVSLHLLLYPWKKVQKNFLVPDSKPICLHSILYGLRNYSYSSHHSPVLGHHAFRHCLICPQYLSRIQHHVLL